MNLSRQTPRRQAASVSQGGRIPPLAAGPRPPILCLDAHAPATAPWTDAPPRTRLPATRAHGRETGASQGGAPQGIPQAARLARARPAPAAATGSRVADDR